jgi:hypothetical protein
MIEYIALIKFDLEPFRRKHLFDSLPKTHLKRQLKHFAFFVTHFAHSAQRPSFQSHIIYPNDLVSLHIHLDLSHVLT